MPRKITQQQATQAKVAINSLIKVGKKLSDLSDEQLHVLALMVNKELSNRESMYARPGQIPDMDKV